MADVARALDEMIAALNAQRTVLGGKAVDAAIDALRRHALRPANDGVDPAPGQRLWQVSVLFVDVANSTELLSQCGAEDADELLGQALQQFATRVQQHGGEVLRFTGDGLKAAFGGARMREDDAVHAVQAGLDILQAAHVHARQVQDRLGLAGFGVRVGIHTGPVLLGGGAEQDRSAMGHAVHLAARMEQSAPVGQLRISADTWAQVRGLFHALPQAPLWVKGHPHPLQTYLVQGRVADADAVQRGVEGVATPLMGRDVELDSLLQCHAQALRARQLQVCTVVAEAGLGKTRLRQELLQRLSLQDGSEGLMQARAQPDSVLQPYGLVRQLLARWLSITDDLDADSARARLVAGVAPWLGPRGAVRAQVLGQLIGMDFDAVPAVRALGPRELREQALAALVDLCCARAATQPLVLVLDDLHWADDASLDVVQRLTRPAPVPLLLLLLTRPALQDRRPELLHAADGAHHSRLQLRALGEGHGRHLLLALLQHLPEPPPELLELLLQRSEGNPFYLEELLRMLIDEGVIDAGCRPWTLRAGWQHQARVPATLAGVLQARLHTLSAEQCLALQQASIVGPVFWTDVLQAVAPAAPAALPDLCSRALVLPREHSSFAGTDELAFHHHLLHEVTYGTVLKAARRQGHAQVARWLATRAAERAGEFLAITATHFERAGDSVQALDYYERAYVDAKRRCAHVSAVAHIEAALRQPALRSPMWHFQLLSMMQSTLEDLGQSARAQAVEAQMSAWAETHDSDAMRADVLCVRMLAADREGHSAEAQRLAQQVLALAEAAQAPTPAALALGELAWLALIRKQFGIAQQHLEQGLRWAHKAATLGWREGGNPRLAYQLQLIGIEMLAQQNRWAQARQAQAATLAQLAPDRFQRERLSLLLQMANTARALGDLQAAAQIGAQAVALAHEIDFDRLRADAANERASLAQDQGDADARRQAAEQSLQLARRAGHAVAQAAALRHLAGVAAQQGQLDKAGEQLRASLRLYEGSEMRTEVMMVRVEMAQLDARAGRRDQARMAVLDVLQSASSAEAEAAVAAEAPAANEARPEATRWSDLHASELLTAHRVLAADDHPWAADLLQELLRRLRQQWEQCPDDAARRQLVRGVPHWSETVRVAQASDTFADSAADLVAGDVAPGVVDGVEGAADSTPGAAAGIGSAGVPA